MKTVRIVLGVFLVLIFALLVFLLVKTSQDVRKANAYISFVTETTNACITKVEEATKELNTLAYNDEKDSLDDIREVATQFNNLINEAESAKKTFETPYAGEEIDQQFDAYLMQAKELKLLMDDVVTSIENLEDKEIYDAKIADYIVKSEKLNESAVELQETINKFEGNYKNIDLNRLIYGLPFTQ